jgi:ribosomal protein S27AE
MVENLKTINAKGMNGFLADPTENYRCPTCGDVVSVHYGTRYSCGYIKKKTDVSLHNCLSTHQL